MMKRFSLRMAAAGLTGLYFAYFLVVLPLLGLFETPRQLPASIADAVLGKAKKGGAPVTAGAAAAPQTKG